MPNGEKWPKSNAKYSAALPKIKGRKTRAFSINPGPKGAPGRPTRRRNELTARKSMARTKAATKASSKMGKSTQANQNAAYIGHKIERKVQRMKHW